MAELKAKTVERRTIKRMTTIGTWREEFAPAVRMYARMYMQLEQMERDFENSGSVVTEEYTNKAGATNVRKTALWQSLQDLRRDVADMEDRLGLSPAGLKRINSDEIKKRRTVSKLESALAAML